MAIGRRGWAHQPIHSRKVPSAMDSTLCPTMGLTSEPLKRPSRGPMTHAAERPATPPGQAHRGRLLQCLIACVWGSCRSLTLS